MKSVCCEIKREASVVKSLKTHSVVNVETDNLKFFLFDGSKNISKQLDESTVL